MFYLSGMFLTAEMRFEGGAPYPCGGQARQGGDVTDTPPIAFNLRNNLYEAGGTG